jgi:hypothetical protein
MTRTVGEGMVNLVRLAETEFSLQMAIGHHYVPTPLHLPTPASRLHVRGVLEFVPEAMRAEAMDYWCLCLAVPGQLTVFTREDRVPEEDLRELFSVFNFDSVQLVELFVPSLFYALRGDFNG